MRCPVVSSEAVWDFSAQVGREIQHFSQRREEKNCDKNKLQIIFLDPEIGGFCQKDIMHWKKSKLLRNCKRIMEIALAYVPVL